MASLKMLVALSRLSQQKMYEYPFRCVTLSIQRRMKESSLFSQHIDVCTEDLVVPFAFYVISTMY